MDLVSGGLVEEAPASSTSSPRLETLLSRYDAKGTLKGGQCHDDGSGELMTSRDAAFGRIMPGGGGARGASRLAGRRTRRFGGTPTWEKCSGSAVGGEGGAGSIHGEGSSCGNGSPRWDLTTDDGTNIPDTGSDARPGPVTEAFAPFSSSKTEGNRSSRLMAVASSSGRPVSESVSPRGAKNVVGEDSPSIGEDMISCLRCGDVEWSNQKLCSKCEALLQGNGENRRQSNTQQTRSSSILNEEGRVAVIDSPYSRKIPKGTLEQDGEGQGNVSPESDGAVNFVDSGNTNGNLIFGGGYARALNQTSEDTCSSGKIQGDGNSDDNVRHANRHSSYDGGEGGRGGGDGDGSSISLLDREKLRLLYMCKQYTVDDESAGKKDRWVRTQPMLVLIYEGIIDEVFDYDYAPQAERVKGKRIYINISQEGRDDLDDLREAGYLYALKLTSESYQSSTALRINQKGLDYLDKHLDDASRKAVDGLICKNGGELVDVVYQADVALFKIFTPSGSFEKFSTITDIEAVSYVSSPFIPSSLSVHSVELTDNSGRCLELENFTSNIKDELSENILLDDVFLVVCEWVPMGGNQIVALNDKLGSSERVQGGFFTATIDEFPDATQFRGKNDGMTAVRLLDYDETSYVNFEAEVFFENDENILQIENFGVHFGESGLVTYGLRLNAIMDRVKTNLSLDLMSRLLVDVTDDSSKVVSNLFAAHQKAMLDLTFLEDADNRDKFNCILADAIHPKMPAEKYMDKEENENEIKQVIGDTYMAHDLSEDELIIFGKSGVLLAGPDSLRHQASVITYSGFMARSIYMKCVFNRCFILADVLKRARGIIENYENNPENMELVRRTLSTCTENVITLGEIQIFLEESVDGLVIPQPFEGDEAGPAHDMHFQNSFCSIENTCSYREASQKLAKILDLEDAMQRLLRRAIDMRKTIDGCANELGALREMSAVIGATKKITINEGIENTTKNLEDAFRAQARNSTSLEIMQVVLAGSLAFDIVDRTFGQYMSIADRIGWVVDNIQPVLVELPLMWFALNMTFWIILGGGLIVLMRRLSYLGNAVDAKKIRVNRRVNIDRLAEYLKLKDIKAVDIGEDEKSTVKKYTWVEVEDKAKWKGISPRFDVVVDERYGFILSAFIQVSKRQCELSADAVWKMFLADLEHYCILVASFDSEFSSDVQLDIGANTYGEMRSRCHSNKMELKPDFARVS